MRDLIRRVIKEQTKNIDEISKGITIAVKILKKQYPFIVGWVYDEPPKTYGTAIYVYLEVDTQKTIEFYGMNLRVGYEDYVKNSIEDRSTFAYPFSTLEYPEDFDVSKANKKIDNDFIEIYEHMVPDNLKMISNFGGRNWVGYFKDLRINSYIFVK
jgi:hypothetical protein